MHHVPARTLRLRALCGTLISLVLSFACPVRASVNATITAPNKYLVIIGASYAEEWHTPALPGYNVINKAICGQQTSDVRARFEKDVIALKPDAVLIWGHNNDVLRSSPQNMPATRRLIEQNYQAMVEQARAARITPILVTELTLPIPDTIKEKLLSLIGSALGKIDYRVQKNTEIKALNSWLRDYARAQNINLLDLEAALDSSNGTRRVEYARQDRSHITPAGYDAITRYVVAELTRCPSRTECVQHHLGKSAPNSFSKPRL